MRSRKKCDPVYLLEAGAPRDEYELEILEIVASAQNCSSVEEIANLIQEVFSTHFPDMAQIDRQEYLTAAKKIWSRLHAKQV
jgi:capsular polysaccharide biosynthesis protein